MNPPAKILVADDNETVRALFTRDLKRQGHNVTAVEDGDDALIHLDSHPVDVLLLDIDMPRLDGLSVLKAVRADTRYSDLHVLIVSANDEMELIAECIESGADDYLSKPCNSTLLHARINACLEKKRARQQEEQFLRDLQAWKDRLRSELDEASNYVRSILPQPISQPFTTRWIYLPSSELGGDTFGFHEIRPGIFAVFLLDVSGHGVGAALLSVSVGNILRGGSLSDADMADPSSVLVSLNKAFPMSDNNDRYFTIWYGVYHLAGQRLVYASAGHPHPVLDGSCSTHQFASAGPAVGLLPEASYTNAEMHLISGDRLVLYSDGARELCNPGGNEIGKVAFHTIMLSGEKGSPERLEAILQGLRAYQGASHFPDDLSLLEIEF